MVDAIIEHQIEFRHLVEHRDNGHREQEPANRVAGLAPGDDQSHGGERQQGRGHESIRRVPQVASQDREKYADREERRYHRPQNQRRRRRRQPEGVAGCLRELRVRVRGDTQP